MSSVAFFFSFLLLDAKNGYLEIDLFFISEAKSEMIFSFVNTEALLILNSTTAKMAES